MWIDACINIIGVFCSVHKDRFNKLFQRPQFQNNQNIRQGYSLFNINIFSRQITPGHVNNNRYGVSSRPRFTSPIMGQRK